MAPTPAPRARLGGGKRPSKRGLGLFGGLTSLKEGGIDEACTPVPTELLYRTSTTNGAKEAGDPPLPLWREEPPMTTSTKGTGRPPPGGKAPAQASTGPDFRGMGNRAYTTEAVAMRHTTLSGERNGILDDATVQVSQIWDSLKSSVSVAQEKYGQTVKRFLDEF
ncbi:unnamed protein product [Phytomonas sp. Hart1]|nr:unnamed protein product [Phytomonas sp. Hart1]|eukprot:CCW69412.1 unnamed protein product [Phytomonas sp. isolate Hart1]